MAIELIITSEGLPALLSRVVISGLATIFGLLAILALNNQRKNQSLLLASYMITITALILTLENIGLTAIHEVAAWLGYFGIFFCTWFLWKASKE